MPAPINVTIFQLINGFFQKVGILNPDLQCKVNFLYNARTLNRFENQQPNNKTVDEVGFNDGSKVLVIDLQNILGA